MANRNPMMKRDREREKAKKAGKHVGRYETGMATFERRKGSSEHPVESEMRKAGVKKGSRGHKLTKSILGVKHSKEDLAHAAKHMHEHMR